MFSHTHDDDDDDDTHNAQNITSEHDQLKLLYCTVITMVTTHQQVKTSPGLQHRSMLAY